MSVKTDLEMCIENESSIGINVSAMFGEILSITPSDAKTTDKTVETLTTLSKDDLIDGIAEDGEPLW